MTHKRKKHSHSLRSRSLDFFKSKIGQFVNKKKALSFAKQIYNVHSNPSSFVSMLAGNKTMTDAQKVKSLKTYIRKHGRRSSTLD